jgi:hypothetical protein
MNWQIATWWQQNNRFGTTLNLIQIKVVAPATGRRFDVGRRDEFGVAVVSEQSFFNESQW